MVRRVPPCAVTLVCLMKSQAPSCVFVPSPPGRGSRCSLEVLQLSVQQEGEADMDVELLRKGLLAVKLKGEEIKGRKASAGKGDDTGGAGEEGDDLMMPGGWLAGRVGWCFVTGCIHPSSGAVSGVVIWGGGIHISLWWSAFVP